MDLTFSVLIGIIWTSVLLLAALGLVLLVPIHLKADGAVENLAGDGACHVSWCWGLLQIRATPDDGLELLVLGRSVYRFERGPKKEREKTDKRPLRLSAVVEHRTLLREVADRAFDASGLDAEVWGRIGLGRPDETALIAQLLQYLDPPLSGLRVDIGPDYTRRVVALNGRARARIWPPQMLAITLWFLIQDDGRRFLKEVRAT